MNTLSDFVMDLPGQLNKLPAAAIIALMALCVGVALKKARFFPNRFIPLMVIVICSVLYGFIGNPGSISPDMRHPECVLHLYGAILGFFTWAAHKFLFKKLEKFLPAGFFSNGFDTEFKTKPPTT